jgi:hypothetical protein
VQEAAAQQHRFVVRPSHIAGIGVYTKETIPAKQILLEYQGEAATVSGVLTCDWVGMKQINVICRGHCAPSAC